LEIVLQNDFIYGTVCCDSFHGAAFLVVVVVVVVNIIIVVTSSSIIIGHERTRISTTHLDDFGGVFKSVLSEPIEICDDQVDAVVVVAFQQKHE